MRYLLDTHIWLWLLESPTKVASPVRKALETADELVLSAASVWEIAIKANLGKLIVQQGVEAARKELAHGDRSTGTRHHLGARVGRGESAFAS